MADLAEFIKESRNYFPSTWWGTSLWILLTVLVCAAIFALIGIIIYALIQVFWVLIWVGVGIMWLGGILFGKK